MSKKFFILLGLWTALMSSCASSYNATAPVFGYEGNSIKTNVTAELDMENAKQDIREFLAEFGRKYSKRTLGNKAHVLAIQFFNLEKPERNKTKTDRK